MGYYTFPNLVIFVSYLLPFAYTFILWPSKKNIVFLLQTPMFLLAYLGGTIFLFDNTIRSYSISYETVLKLSLTMLVGAIAHVIFMNIGFYGRLRIKSLILAYIHKLKRRLKTKKAKKIGKRIVILFLLGAALISYAYYRMGFVPIFAEKPFVAKFFAEEYQASYRPVAHYFRLALNTLRVILPFSILFLFTSKRSKMLYFFMSLVIFLLLLSTLRRSPMANPIVHFLLVFFIWYQNGKFILPYMIFYICLFMFGSSFNAVVSYFLGLTETIQLKSVITGVPDVKDLLRFWDSFLEKGYDFIWGRTIYGGLIPYHYKWNPAVVTKLVVGAGTNVPSGGFRLPQSVWGYLNFGMLGTLIWSMWYGLTSGIILKSTKHIIVNYSSNFTSLFLLLIALKATELLLTNVLKLQIDHMVCLFLYVFILAPLFINLRIPKTK